MLGFSCGIDNSSPAALVPPAGDLVMAAPFLLATSRVRMHGNSFVVTLTKRVRDALGVKLGDHVIFRRYGRSVFMTVIRERVGAAAPNGQAEQDRAAAGA